MNTKKKLAFFAALCGAAAWILPAFCAGQGGRTSIVPASVSTRFVLTLQKLGTHARIPISAAGQNNRLMIVQTCPR
jgi:hypothetical protein